MSMTAIARFDFRYQLRAGSFPPFFPVKLIRTLAVVLSVWLVAVSVAHWRLNLRQDEDGFSVGFLPVTCHLTCPVTHYINKNLSGRGEFTPRRFAAWPELKEMFISHPDQMPASFILAPMAIALREQGVKIKIVHLGHRDGSAVMVHKDSGIFQTADLRGKTVEIGRAHV